MSDKLRTRRSQLGITQAQVAKALGVSVMTINRWEHGKTRPDDYGIRMLTQFFDATAEELGLVSKTVLAQTSTSTPQTVQSSVATLPISVHEDFPQVPFETPIRTDFPPIQISSSSIQVQTNSSNIQVTGQPSLPSSPVSSRSRRIILFAALILSIFFIVGVPLFIKFHTMLPSPTLISSSPHFIGSLKMIPPSDAKVACGSLRNNGVGVTWQGSNGGYNGKGYNGSTYSQCDGNYSFIQVSAGAQAIFFPKEHIPASKHFVDIWIYIPPLHAEAAADYSVAFDTKINQSWSICQSNYRYWYLLGTVHIPDGATNLTMQALSPGNGMPCKEENASKNSSGTFAEDVAALYFH